MDRAAGSGSRAPLSPIEPVAGGVRLRLRVQPRASRTEVAGRHGDELRIRVAAPPVEGAANEALVRFLAERLRVPRSAVEVAAGAAGKRKVVVVSGLTPGEAEQRLGVGLARPHP